MTSPGDWLPLACSQRTPGNLKFTKPLRPHRPPWTTIDGDVYNFTSFADSKLNTDEPVSVQLQTQLKRLLYSRRNSAKEFYDLSTPNEEFYELKYRN